MDNRTRAELANFMEHLDVDNMHAGSKAEFGALLSDIGKALMEEAKQYAEKQLVGDTKSWSIGNVRFERRKATETTRVDTSYVKAHYPADLHPEFWKTITQKAHVRVHLPKE